MKGAKRLWMPVLLGVVLISTVVGVASARPNARPQEQAWRVLAIDHGACVPEKDTTDWEYWNDYLECDTASCRFICALDFPAAGEQAVGAVNVKRLTFYATDQDGAGDMHVFIFKTHPPSGNCGEMAHATSTGQSSSVRSFVDTSIAGTPIYRVQGLHLWLYFGGTLIRYHGAYIHYTWM